MRKRILWLLVILVVLAAGVYTWRHRFGVPEDFADMADQYKYGSVGSDHPLTRAPLPYWIWKALPELFPPSAPIGDWYKPRNDKKGYDAFGLVTEPVMAQPRGVEGSTVFERPIGFSKRTVFGLDFVGVNCAFCHTSTLRRSAEDKAPQIVLGGIGNAVDIEQYFRYLFAALSDPGFDDTDKVMAAVREQNTDMGFFERLAYRFAVIPYLRHMVFPLRSEFDFINPVRTKPPAEPDFGPGRVDTWAGYKTEFLDVHQRDTLEGIVDFPPVWNQKARGGMRLHWDGNTDVLDERNIISALALIGKRLDYLDVARLRHVSDFITWLLPPRFADRAPDTVPRLNATLVERGAEVFQRDCATCHAPDGARIGRVERVEDLGTDPKRVGAFTHALADTLNQLGTDAWKLRNFTPQHGYANTLLDGIWLRGPYLHNGSVPTLRDLLKEPAERPKRFCRGSDVYDWINVGYVSGLTDPAGARPCGEFFLYDTSVAGNSNEGHLQGTSLEAGDKDALLEFLKTL